MSTHPNVILLCTLTPDNLSRATYRAILGEHGIAEDDDSQDVTISGDDYHVKVMEESYDDDFQISAAEGDIVVFDMVTYGYGEKVAWENLEAQKLALHEWATGICERHKCSFKIFVTANYW